MNDKYYNISVCTLLARDFVVTSMCKLNLEHNGRQINVLKFSILKSSGLKEAIAFLVIIILEHWMVVK